ncbi:glucose 1-dehydrogenase [Aromatoleum toluolicum]|uniref:Glucose 1-dehydrogenase n=1 Tax=Aromatoleum toluolicum TaxID=90060 RepID=A0ABX1NHR7_9RHOO|nr:glucose 1-dehydrogenase [Aromatoleum toluolicum]NMF98859.1 glucose 1-dehydrogenase [Aromatoleum toluolicum]
MDSSSLEGKVALVTGAARGLGAAIAHEVAAAGARVVVTDLDEGRGRATAEDLGAMFLQQDVTREEDWSHVMARTVEAFGGLDVVVNNAGIETASLMVDCDLADFRRVMAVNADGCFLGTKWAMRVMRPGGAAGRGGAVVNLSSVAGLVGVAGLGAYCAAKGAVRLLTKSAAIESARLGYGVRVNSLHPAVIKTDMGEAVVRSLVDLGLAADVAGAEALMLQMHPMGYGRPEDVAAAVRYLAAGSGRWINGAELVLDGGLTAG